MGGKLQESIMFLKCCSKLETEASKLYEALSKKVNQPESSFILGFSYDSLKAAKTMEAILDYFDPQETEGITCKKEITELVSCVCYFNKKVAKTNNVNYEKTCELLKELSNLEDQLSALYTNYAQTTAVRLVADEFSKITIDANNFKKIFETTVEQKQKHKETILEIIYAFETKEADRLRTATPLVRYQNPDAWIRTSFPSAQTESAPA